MKRERNAKQAFIEGTVRVVARDGLDKTTTKAIATEAGLSEAYIYRCFESKEALLCAAFHMEDVAFAYFLKQNLVGMHIQNAPWKDRAFQLWSASWRFILGRKDDCLFYLRYYYSANCRTYAYEEHLQCFQELFAAVEQTFKPEANVNMLLHQVFDTMLSFAARVLGGEMPDDDATTQWAFEQIYSFVVPNVREELLISAGSTPTGCLAEERSADVIIQVAKPVLRQKKLYLITKRVFDIVCSFLGLLILAIPMMIIALIITIDSPGAPIFKQERLGINGKPFMIYKFRSMRLDAEENGPQWADEQDPRCTHFGQILRRTRLDELPQLYNILRGDMSFVGPRPERAYFYREFEKYIPGFSNRLLVTPGLTGYAQVNGGYSLKPEEKIIYDMEYIERQSIILDIKCLLKTVHIVFSHEGAR